MMHIALEGYSGISLKYLHIVKLNTRIVTIQVSWVLSTLYNININIFPLLNNSVRHTNLL